MNEHMKAIKLIEHLTFHSEEARDQFLQTLYGTRAVFQIRPFWTFAQRRAWVVFVYEVVGGAS